VKVKGEFMIIPIILALAFLISSSCSSLQEVPVKQQEKQIPEQGQTR
jgi:hypothetical protein